MRVRDFFCNEKHFYESIQPLLPDVGPKVLFVNNKEIVMEDLSKRGYDFFPEPQTLNKNECLAVLKVIFHRVHKSKDMIQKLFLFSGNRHISRSNTEPETQEPTTLSRVGETSARSPILRGRKMVYGQVNGLCVRVRSKGRGE